MKAKTKIQKEIIALRETLKPITQEQKEEAKTMHTKYVLMQYSTKHICLECSHNWSAPKKETLKKKSISCPCCKTKLKVDERLKNGHEEAKYFGVLDTVKGWQVVRIFYSEKFYNKSGVDYSIREVVNHFINDKGNIQTISAPVFGMSFYKDHWTFGPLEFRSKSNASAPRVRIKPHKYSKKVKVLPVFKRNGFKTTPYYLMPQDLFSLLAKDSRIETLFKQKQIVFIDAAITSQLDLNKYWDVVKVAVKHGFKATTENLLNWRDYIDLLHFFGKDLKNPKFVCPQDLEKEHNRYLFKKQRQIAAQKIEDLKKSIQKDNKLFKQQKSKFFDLAFVKGGLRVEPLKSVEEFVVNGEKMKHCVFANKYHMKENALILEAKIDNQTIETVHIDLKTFEIKQVRGRFNKPSKHNSKVVRLVQQNMDKVREIALKSA